MGTVIKQWPLILASVIVLVITGEAGMSLGWSSPILGRLNSENSTIPLTNNEGSWIATIMPLTAVFTAPFTALSLQYLGRKYTILLAFFPFIVAWSIIAFATTPLELIIARTFSGIGFGLGFTTVSVYLGEISPDNIRGGIGICMAVVSNMGNIWIYTIGAYFDLWISSLASILPMLIIVIYKWLPESPYFLVQKGHMDDAKKALQKLRNTDDVDKELTKIETLTKNSNKEPMNIFKELIFESGHRQALFISLSTILFSQFTGGVTFAFYAHLLFQKAGNVDANIMAIIKAFLQLLISIGAAYVVDKIGKKPLLVISSIGCACSMACEGIYFYLQDNDYNVNSIWWLPLTGMTLFNISFMIGLGPISLAYLGELFHPKVKSVTVCLGTIFLNLGGFIIGKLYQIMVDLLGNSAPFFIFTGIGILSAIFCISFVPETKGKSLDDIQYYMKHKKFRDNSIII